MMNVENILKNIEKEIKSTQQGIEQAESLERLMEVAKAYKGEDKVVSFREIYDRILSRPLVEKLYTGWTNLDNLLSGFRRKQLIILSGIMKHGKTSFAMDMSSKLPYLKPLWLAQEESLEELMEKYIERGEQPPVGFGPENSSFVNTAWVEFKIIEAFSKYKCEIVFIDNIDFLRPREFNRNDSKADRIEQTVRELKLLAKRLNVIIVLIVHVTKASKADSNPTFEDLKGSVSIGQLADKAILVWRETKRGNNGELEITNNTNVSVQLNRQGKTGNVKMVYDNGRFTEQEWKTDEETAKQDFKNF